MARAAALQEERLPADALDGVQLPRENRILVGHAAAEKTLLESYRSGRMQHGWVLAGPRGIGKATLALRLARFIFAHPDPNSAEVAAAGDLGVSPDHAAARRLARGVHPNLLHLQREWNEKTKKYRSELSVESVRRITPFLGTTAGETGWRVVIVDPADDMTPSAANALLKSLEEPPRRTLFILVARSAGGLIPTILSRCRVLQLQALTADELGRVISDVAPDLAGEPEDRVATGLAEGSVRRLIELRRNGGTELYRLMLAAIHGADRHAQLRLSGQAGSPQAAETFLDLFEDYLARRVRGLPEPVPDVQAPSLPLVTWAELWDKATLSGREVETYNLDRRHFVLDLLESSAAALRASGVPNRP